MILEIRYLFLATRRGYNTGMNDSTEFVTRAFVRAIIRQDVEGLAGMTTTGNRDYGIGNSHPNDEDLSMGPR